MRLFCPRCKKKTDIKSDEEVYLSKKYHVIKGKCSVCREDIYKILTQKSDNAK